MNFLRTAAALAGSLGIATIAAAQAVAPVPQQQGYWVESYGVVILAVVLGAVIFLRPGARTTQDD